MELKEKKNSSQVQYIFEQTPTETTPEIRFNYEKADFKISGVSMPSNPRPFFEELFKWFDEYKTQPIENAKFVFHLDYFNTSSSKFLLELMKKIQDIGNNNKIVWQYADYDEDLKEVGEDFQEIVGPNFIELQEISSN
jgi:hypothetical protein